MRAHIISLLCLLTAVSASSNIHYEYWFDNRTDNVMTGTMSMDSLRLQFDTACLPEGLHYSNLRFIDEKGNCSALLRRPFYVQSPTEESRTAGVRLWLDDNIKSTTLETNSHCVIKIERSVARVHSLNILPIGEDGTLGSVKSVLFFASSPLEAEVASYRYWFDEDSAYSVSVEHNKPVLSTTIEVSMLAPGIHSFNFQPVNISGISGQIYTEKFEVLLLSNISDVDNNGIGDITVYTISGVCVLKEVGIGRLSQLTPGVYIINGVKTVLK